MQTLLNTLFIQTQGSYLNLDHETVKVQVEGSNRAQIPLHHLEGISVFGNVMFSPFLIHKCARDGKQITWFSESGRFQARTQGPIHGNVLLRKAQYEALLSEEKTLLLAQQFVFGKIANARAVLQRHRRDYPETPLEAPIQAAADSVRQLESVASLESLRGIEGNAAADYFSAFPLLIREKQFSFTDRNRRPPRDPVNALLSFIYALLTTDCAGALEGVGLDPQVGFLHVLRPGRPALALDLMEEFRSWFADRIALSLMNRKQVDSSCFEERVGGAVMLNEKGRKLVIGAYQTRKAEKMQHPIFEEPLPIGILFHVQARLLARHLRGDLEFYPPFRWK